MAGAGMRGGAGGTEWAKAKMESTIKAPPQAAQLPRGAPPVPQVQQAQPQQSQSVPNAPKAQQQPQDTHQAALGYLASQQQMQKPQPQYSRAPVAPPPAQAMNAQSAGLTQYQGDPRALSVLASRNQMRGVNPTAQVYAPNGNPATSTTVTKPNAVDASKTTQGSIGNDSIQALIADLIKARGAADLTASESDEAMASLTGENYANPPPGTFSRDEWNGMSEAERKAAYDIYNSTKVSVTDPTLIGVDMTNEEWNALSPEDKAAYAEFSRVGRNIGLYDENGDIHNWWDKDGDGRDDVTGESPWGEESGGAETGNNTINPATSGDLNSAIESKIKELIGQDTGLTDEELQHEIDTLDQQSNLAKMKQAQEMAARGFGDSGVAAANLGNIDTATRSAVNDLIFKNATLRKEGELQKLGTLAGMLNQGEDLAFKKDAFEKTFGLDTEKWKQTVKDQDEADAWAALVNMLALTGTDAYSTGENGEGGAGWILDQLTKYSNGQGGMSPAEIMQYLSKKGTGDGQNQLYVTPTNKKTAETKSGQNPDNGKDYSVPYNQTGPSKNYPSPPPGWSAQSAGKGWNSLTEADKAAAWGEDYPYNL